MAELRGDLPSGGDALPPALREEYQRGLDAVASAGDLRALQERLVREHPGHEAALRRAFADVLPGPLVEAYCRADADPAARKALAERLAREHPWFASQLRRVFEGDEFLQGRLG